MNDEPAPDVAVVVSRLGPGDQTDAPREGTATAPWTAFIHPDVVLQPGSLTELVRESEEHGLAGVRAGVQSVGSGDYWSRQLARAHNRGRLPRESGVGASLVARDLGASTRAVAESRSTAVSHSCRPGLPNAGRHWIAHGIQLGRLIREDGAGGILVAGRVLVGSGSHIVEDWRHPVALPYTIATALGTLSGMLRGLWTPGLARPARSRSALIAAAFCAVLGLIFVLGAGLGALVAVLVATIVDTQVAVRAAHLPAIVPLGAIAAVVLIELSKAVGTGRGRSLPSRFETLAVVFALAALSATVLRLARLIGIL